MKEINENPKSIFENINELLNLGARDRKHAFHTPVFSSFNLSFKFISLNPPFLKLNQIDNYKTYRP